MQNNKTVTVNGRRYDAVTGLPIESSSAAPQKAPAKKPTRQGTSSISRTPSATLHAAQQRSKTLHRRSTKKPGPPKRPQPGQHMDISRSKTVERFAKHPVTFKRESETPDAPAKSHPIASRALAKVTPKKEVSATPKQIKEAAIASSTKKMDEKQPKKRSGFFANKASRRFVIASVVFIVLILGAYLTYVNIPSIAVNIAAIQSGVKATYPEYKPDGYALQQPVEYTIGEVVLHFTSNSGTGEFSISQTRSTYDSSAVLDNIVRPEAGENYVTTQERGLTIYGYDGNAAWVNGGILYVIESDAPLSGEQIRRIATSL